MVVGCIETTRPNNKHNKWKCAIFIYFDFMRIFSFMWIVNTNFRIDATDWIHCPALHTHSFYSSLPPLTDRCTYISFLLTQFTFTRAFCMHFFLQFSLPSVVCSLKPFTKNRIFRLRGNFLLFLLLQANISVSLQLDRIDSLASVCVCVLC